MRKRAALFFFLLTLVAVGSLQAKATILVDQTSHYANYIGPGGGDWSAAFTNALAGQSGGYFLGSIDNPADVAAATAILVVYRSPFEANALSAAGLANLSAFRASGGRILLTGEITFDPTWNNSILGFASNGAASVGDNVGGLVTPIVANQLTAGVGSVLLQGSATASGGGTQLFSQNFATLWGENVLTVLDSSPFRNLAAPGSGDAVWRENVADWLGASVVTPVPELSTWAMIVAGFGGIGLVTYRRRKLLQADARC